MVVFRPEVISGQSLRARWIQAQGRDDTKQESDVVDDPNESGHDSTIFNCPPIHVMPRCMLGIHLFDLSPAEIIGKPDASATWQATQWHVGDEARHGGKRFFQRYGRCF